MLEGDGCHLSAAALQCQPLTWPAFKSMAVRPSLQQLWMELTCESGVGSWVGGVSPLCVVFGERCRGDEDYAVTRMYV